MAGVYRATRSSTQPTSKETQKVGITAAFKSKSGLDASLSLRMNSTPVTNWLQRIDILLRG